MKVLVTGGAGYIGSVVVDELVAEGHDVVVLDDLSRGHKEAVNRAATLVVGSILDRILVQDVMSGGIDGVIHLAALTTIEESMKQPERYYNVNVLGGLWLLDAMRCWGVNKIIFSSSAATYGDHTDVVRENSEQRPVNPYGETKLVFERVLKWYGQAYGLRHVSFRYFNVAGATAERGQDHVPETTLIPSLLQAVQRGQVFKINGNDYPTKDGTCLRDYVHVWDIARAHVLALQRLEAGTMRDSAVFNLASVQGWTVTEVVLAAEKVLGRHIRCEFAPRRPGDPAVIIASAGLARGSLGWMTRYNSMEQIIQTAWDWQKEHPYGYNPAL